MTRVVFNPFSESFRRNPYETYSALRTTGPFRSLGMWIFTRHADVKDVLRDRRFSSALIPSLVHRRLDEFGMSCPEVTKLGQKAIVFTDNPDHARLRRLANVVFHPSQLESLRPLAATLVQQHLKSFATQARGDFVGQVARPIPLKLLLSWLAIDHEHMEAVATWNHAIRYFLEPGAVNRSQFAHIYQSLTEFLAFFASYIADRQGRAGADLISQMLVRTSKNDGFTVEEAAYMCVMAFVAGAETTQALLGNAMLLLASHPAQLNKLLSGEVAVSRAANEILRFEAPLQMTKRVAMEDVAVAGVNIKANDQILLCLAAANHDNDVFADADSFDIGRSNSELHLGFGYGAHACLGARLAQIQLESLLEEIIRHRWQPVVHEAPRWQRHSQIMRGLDELPLDLQTQGETVA
ncbi:MAG: cytochrome P450 [Ramlibacter sp.]|nr:cytochrome P450 [Ramlibacter sp.]